MPALTHSPADIIQALLIDLTLGVSPGATPFPVYVNFEPVNPDNCLTVYDIQAKESGRDYTGERTEHHGIQVRIRSSDSLTGNNKARGIANAFDLLELNKTITKGGAIYVVSNVSRESSIIPLGSENTSRRFLFTINCFVTLREVL